MRKSFITTFFPVPKFLAMSSVGLDISDQSIKYAGLTQRGGGLRLGKHGSIRLDPGVISLGKIIDHSKLVSVLADLSKKEKIDFVRVSLSEQQVYLFTLVLPRLEMKDVRGSVELQLEDHIPISAEEAVFDFEVLSSVGGSLVVQVVAAPKDIIRDYVNVIQGAGMTLLSIEVEGQAIVRTVIPKGSPDTVMVVDFGELRTGISVVSAGKVHFTSTVDIGGINITKLIEKNFGIGFEEAEELKQKHGLRRNTTHSELFPVLLNGISVLRDEINRHFIYWHTHKDDKSAERPQIQKIILCGGDSNLQGFADYLSMSMRTRVEMADVWVNINSFSSYIPEINFNNSLGFATALGLALRDSDND